MAIPKSSRQKGQENFFKLMTTIAAEEAKVASTKMQVDYYKDRDRKKAESDAIDDLKKDEKEFRDKFLSPIETAIGQGKYDEAMSRLVLRDNAYLYDTYRTELVSEDRRDLFPTADELVSRINNKQESSRAGERLLSEWVSNDIPVSSNDPDVRDKSKIYDEMSIALADETLSLEEFNKALAIAKNMGFAEELGLSTTKIDASKGMSPDAAQSDLNKLNMGRNRYIDNNYYTESGGLEYFKTISEQDKNRLTVELGQEGVEKYNNASATDKELVRKRAWQERSSLNAENLMYEQTQTIVARTGEDNFFLQMDNEFPGKSLQAQAIVNNYVSLAIESIPELRAENNPDKIIEELSKTEILQKVIDKVGIHLGDYEVWGKYLPTKDKPNKNFRLTLIMD